MCKRNAAATHVTVFGDTFQARARDMSRHFQVTQRQNLPKIRVARG